MVLEGLHIARGGNVILYTSVILLDVSYSMSYCMWKDKYWPISRQYHAHMKYGQHIYGNILGNTYTSCGQHMYGPYFAHILCVLRSGVRRDACAGDSEWAAWYIAAVRAGAHVTRLTMLALLAHVTILTILTIHT